MEGSDAISDSLSHWKQMVQGNSMALLPGLERPVLVIGPQGSGKSTNIGIQMGAGYQVVTEKKLQPFRGRRVERNVKVYRCVQSRARTPQTSDGFASKTLNIGVYQAAENAYLDTAGLNEDRSPAHLLWTRFCSSLLFSLLPCIDCVIVVIDYRSLVSGRAQAFRDMGRSLNSIVPFGRSSPPFFDAMIFLVTYGFEGAERALPEDVQLAAESARQDFEKTLKEKMKRTSETHGTEDEETSELVEDLSIYTLLQTLEKADQKIYMCFPDTIAESFAQCRAVNAMIKHSKRVSKEQLREIAASRSQHKLAVLQQLAKLTASPSKALGQTCYTDLLRKCADNLEQLWNHVEMNRDVVEAVNSDWKEVQRAESAQLESRLNDEKQVLAMNQTAIRNKQLSVERTIIHEAEVKRTCPGSVWWLLAAFGGGWAWGKLRVRHIFEYKGESFESFEVRGGDYTKKIIRKDAQAGILKIRFKSAPGCDLDLKVVIIKQDKDTEVAKCFVESLIATNIQMQDEVERVHRNLTQCRTIQDAPSMQRFLLTEQAMREGDDLEFQTQLRKPAIDRTHDFPFVLSEREVLVPLAQLLELLHGRNVFPSDLAESTRLTIDRFLQEYSRVEKMKERLRTAGYQGSLNLTSEDDIPRRQEDVDPIPPSVVSQGEPPVVQARMISQRHENMAPIQPPVVQARMISQRHENMAPIPPSVVPEGEPPVVRARVIPY